jgi:hypothetical protein
MDKRKEIINLKSEMSKLRRRNENLMEKAIARQQELERLMF